MSQQLPTNVAQAGASTAGGGGNDNLDNPGMDPVNGAGNGPGSNKVGVVGIIGLNLYLVVFALFLIYGLVVLWPGPTPSGQAKPGTPTPSPSASPTATVSPSPAQTRASSNQSPTSTPAPTAVNSASAQPSASPSASPSSPTSPEPKTVTFLNWSFKIWDEQRLLLLVILAGALGSLVHDIRSVYWYVGNRALVKSWLAMYLLLPFTGATLALVFYLVIRGGFFSPQSSFEQTSPFGFAAFAALIGMFSPQAVLKLREVAETLLSKPQPGANSQPQGTVNPGVGAAPQGGNQPVKPKTP